MGATNGDGDGVGRGDAGGVEPVQPSATTGPVRAHSHPPPRRFGLLSRLLQIPTAVVSSSLRSASTVLSFGAQLLTAITNVLLPRAAARALQGDVQIHWAVHRWSQREWDGQLARWAMSYIHLGLLGSSVWECRNRTSAVMTSQLSALVTAAQSFLQDCPSETRDCCALQPRQPAI